MASDALKAKELGNAAFKAGQFVDAIGHYTTALLADRADVTFPLNRAAAYLKLGKNEDAERDCTTALQIKPGHVKALFRRAQARIELRKLQEARTDLEDALKAEPNNESVKAELTKLNAMSTTKAKGSSSAVPPSVSVPAAKRRRVPIRVVETPAQSKIQPPVGGPSQSLSSDGLAPISTRRLTPSNANGSISARPSNSASVAVSTVTPSGSASQSQVRLQAGRSSSSHRAEANGDNPTTARVGGGIFRSSGAHTVVQPPQALNTNGSSASHAPNGNGALNGRTPPRKPPATSSAFTKSWETSSPSERWELLLSLPPTLIPRFFQASLETGLLVSFLQVCSDVLESGSDVLESSSDSGAGPGHRELIRKYLNSFAHVPRFPTLLLFMSAQEKALARGLVERVGGVRGWGV